jgi:hypothetical protein
MGRIYPTSFGTDMQRGSIEIAEIGIAVNYGRRYGA